MPETPAPPTSEPLELTQFDETGTEPSHWLWAARKLRRAAELILREFGALADLAPPGEPVALIHLVPRKGQTMDTDVKGYELSPIFMMLAGLSLENVFKGVCIRRQPEIVKDGTLPKWLTSHSLTQLADRAGVPLSDAEADLLERLHMHVMWAGRYPVPKDSKGWQLHVILKGPHKMAKRAFWMGSDGKVFAVLFDRLAAIIEAPPATPASPRPV